MSADPLARHQAPEQRLVPNIIFLVAAQVASKAFTLVSLYFMGHYLGDLYYGRYAVGAAIPLSFDVVSDLGLSLTLVRDGAGRPRVVRRLVADMLPAKIVLATLFIATTIVSARFLGLPDEIAEVALFVGVARALDSMTSFIRCVFEARERMEYEAASLILDAVVRLLFLVYALLSGFGLVGIAKAFVASSAIVVASTGIIAGRRFLQGFRARLRPRSSLRLVRRGLPLAGVAFFEGLSFRADTLVVGLTLGDVAAGHFSAAARFVEPLLVLPLMVGAAMLPLVSRHLFEGRDSPSRLFRSGLHFAIVAALAEAIVLVGLGDLMLPALFGSEFSGAVPTLRVLAIALLPLSARAMLVNVLTGLGKQQRLLQAQVIGSLTNLSLAIALVPLFRETGAAFAVIGGELVAVLIGVAVVRSVIHVDLQDSVRTFAAGLPAFVVLVALSGSLGPFVATIAALVAFVLGIRLLGVVREEELGYLASVTPRLARFVMVFTGPGAR